MKIIVHPTYFPSIATFAAIVQHEVIWEAHDNFQKQTYRNRCYISTDKGKHMLNIPITHVGGKEGHQKYVDVRTENSYNWKKEHWRTLETAYRTSPFFEFYEDEIRPLYEGNDDSLYDFNLKTIEAVAGCIQMGIPTEKTEKYEVSPETLFDARFLVEAKKEKDWGIEQYTQVFEERHGFIANLSILDLLFNEGTNTLSYLKDLSLDFTND
ncbi:WbqC family protein [Muricauda oceani]|uniref:WbqC family protein n=1 Tax=Flagellimonas oceani TaxID=2698672 RepID=A0A6G7J3X2_9FLAO|nr:WbqC family protein [Allomuricauda oceani]MBW8243193.1 WbqC family protein [Allomuricauda oceani]QII45172.1 WbqC family protein [Allomuricauda oceani]